LISWTTFCHRNPQKAHPWVNARRLRYPMAYMVKIRPPVIAVGDDKKRKGRKGKIHSHSGLYFSSRPR